MGLRHRRFLKDKEAKSFLRGVSGLFGTDVLKLLGQKPRVEVVEFSEGGVLYIIDGKSSMVGYGGELFPALVHEPLLGMLPFVVVDMGAVPHICNGADVMAPGVVDVHGEFKVGTLVVVRDERHSKAIAVGRALVESGEIAEKRRGKVVRTLHFVGDKPWEAITRFNS